MRAYNKGKLTSKDLKAGHGAVMSARCFVDRNVRPSQPAQWQLDTGHLDPHRASQPDNKGALT